MLKFFAVFLLVFVTGCAYSEKEYSAESRQPTVSHQSQGLSFGAHWSLAVINETPYALDVFVIGLGSDHDRIDKVPPYHHSVVKIRRPFLTSNRRETVSLVAFAVGEDGKRNGISAEKTFSLPNTFGTKTVTWNVGRDLRKPRYEARR